MALALRAASLPVFRDPGKPVDKGHEHFGDDLTSYSCEMTVIEEDVRGAQRMIAGILGQEWQKVETGDAPVACKSGQRLLRGG